MPKATNIREINIGTIDVKKTIGEVTNREILVLTGVIATRHIAAMLGCSPQNIHIRLKRAKSEEQEDASVEIKSKQIVVALKDIVASDRSLAKGLPKESKETIGALLGACANILDDLVKDPDITKKMYLDVAKVIMQLAKTKVEIFEHYRRVVGVREFRRIVVDEIRKLEPKVADKIATALQNDERLKWML